jgi:hypothetical protein
MNFNLESIITIKLSLLKVKLVIICTLFQMVLLNLYSQNQINNIQYVELIKDRYLVMILPYMKLRLNVDHLNWRFMCYLNV